MEDKNREKKDQETKRFLDLQKYVPRPASSDEAGIFYAATPEQDAELGCIGHVRMDFGRDGDEFWTTWHPRGDETLNSPKFKAELTEVVNELRRGPLKNLSAMSSYCYTHGGEITGSYTQNYGYIVETPNYRYCLRCNPQRGDYNAYLTCFDLRVHQLAENIAVGKVSFASGEKITYADPEEYLKAIREELPYHPTSGFQYETLTDDPKVRKSVDDILYDMYGEQNPRREGNYGLTEKGKQMLRDAADSGKPHTYSWFVMTGVNTASEQLTENLTLPEAIDRYRALDTGNKRIGVTKDGIATVDFVVMLDGEEQFFHDHERLASFKDDPAISQAVEMLHRELDAQTPTQGMNFGGM